MQLSAATYFLGMNIERDSQARTLKLSQERLTTDLVNSYGMMDGKTRSTPLSTSTKLTKATEENLLDKDTYTYSQLVGSLLYLATCTSCKPWEHWQGTWPIQAQSIAQQPRGFCSTWHAL